MSHKNHTGVVGDRCFGCELSKLMNRFAGGGLTIADAVEGLCSAIAQSLVEVDQRTIDITLDGIARLLRRQVEHESSPDIMAKRRALGHPRLQ